MKTIFVFMCIGVYLHVNMYTVCVILTDFKGRHNIFWNCVVHVHGLNYYVVVGTKPRSTGKAATVFSCLSASLAPKVVHYIDDKINHSGQKAEG